MAKRTTRADAAYAEAQNRIAHCLEKKQPSLELRLMGLTSLPREIGQLTALTELQLQGNELTMLPMEIGRLTALTELSLHNNKLTTLPWEIGQLTALTALDLSYNQLTTLPPEIGRLRALTALGLERNQLATLPSEIGQLTALTALDLSHNQLTTLPKEVGQLTALTELSLHGNTALGILAEVQGPKWDEPAIQDIVPKSPQEIFDYYFALQSAQRLGKTKPLNEAKVLFLGQPEAGKSSLIHALTIGWPTPDFAKTDGIARREWLLKMKDGKSVGKRSYASETLRLNLWDFGGQEIYKATHTFFLTRRAVYVIVTTARKDASMDYELEEWLETARTFGAGHTRHRFSKF